MVLNISLGFHQHACTYVYVLPRHTCRKTCMYTHAYKYTSGYCTHTHTHHQKQKQSPLAHTLDWILFQKMPLKHQPDSPKESKGAKEVKSLVHQQLASPPATSHVSHVGEGHCSFHTQAGRQSRVSSSGPSCSMQELTIRFPSALPLLLFSDPHYLSPKPLLEKASQ